MNTIGIVDIVYKHFTSQIRNGIIPCKLRTKRVVGTVQDDPFDTWVCDNMKKALPSLEIVHSGSLTTPDIVVRDRRSNTIVGFEIKKLIQQKNGSDSRGLTMDYNSCLPCGTTLIKKGNETITVPCFYIFALLNNASDGIVTLIIMDGDFLNYDFNLHKKAKFANTTEYNHGPYGEGSVRHRRMYTYPNPLNYKLKCFHERKVLVVKKQDVSSDILSSFTTEYVVREDIYGNNFYYRIIDESIDSSNKRVQIEEIRDIFAECKTRKEKPRTVALPNLSD